MIDVEQEPGLLKISRFNDDGMIVFENIPIPDSERFEWEYATRLKDVDPKWRSWDNRAIRKSKKTMLSRYRVEEFLYGLPDEVKDRIYKPNRPKVWFCDIEVEVTDDGFPEPANAPNRITTICFAHGQKAFVLSIKPLDESDVADIQKDVNSYFQKYGADFSVKFISFENEYEMLYVFFNKYIPQMPLLTGWNFTNFDWQYLVNRCKRLNIDPSVASPSKKFVGKEGIPQHRPVVDYMMIYKKWDNKVDVKESSKLDYVADQVLKLTKIKYNGTLKDLYEKDFKKYVFYNIVDTLLVMYIDKEISVMGTYLSLANISRVELLGAFSPIRMTETLLVREFYDRNRILVRKGELEEGKTYEGAFVKDPVPGLYEWVVTYDFASLYPTTMRQFNISPETYLGKRDDLEGEEYIRTATGAVFDAKTDSVSRHFLTNLFNRRVQSKEEAKDIEKAIEKLKNLQKQK
jgi:DNA polymerase elongation subunit (family B)